ncbi:hypothetical protein ALC62_12255 [Cyphomyrmex costatus]|uniref:Uncharacterized protein n=1 Tax=Cyphomyrmex costatus TaxID=456900 RepID=A0A151IBM4_9HYME|nr:hypothetical protein ALC62_12255 [Cyphomyrmex costatus]
MLRSRARAKSAKVTIKKPVFKNKIKKKKSVVREEKVVNMDAELKEIKEQLAQMSRLNTEIQELRAKQEKFDEIEIELHTLRARYERERESEQYARDNTSSNQSNIISNLLIDVQKLNIDISKQLPWRAREALAGADFQNVQSIIARLQYLDLNPVEKDNEKNKEEEKKENNQNNQIRNLTVRNKKVEDKENNRYNIYRNKINSRNNTNQFQNQQFEYNNNNRKYQQSWNQNWRDQLGSFNPQYRNQIQNINRYSSYRDNSRYPLRNNNRFNYNNLNRYNEYNQYYQTEGWQPRNGRAQNSYPDAIMQSWQNNANVPRFTPRGGYSYGNENNSTNSINAAQDSQPNDDRQN